MSRLWENVFPALEYAPPPPNPHRYQIHFYIFVYQRVSGESLFDCNICGRGFIQKVALQYHLTTVHSGDSNECKICGKFFKDAQDLKTHIRVHTGTLSLELDSFLLFRSKSRLIRQRNRKEQGCKERKRAKERDEKCGSDERKSTASNRYQYSQKLKS